MLNPNRSLQYKTREEILRCTSGIEFFYRHSDMDPIAKQQVIIALKEVRDMHRKILNRLNSINH
jgi:hypothetical protein